MDEAGSKISAIVLAAGSSLRFGDQNKLLAQLCGSPLISRVVGAVIGSSVWETVVVTGHESDKVAQALATFEVKLVHNPDFGIGMGGSIATGVKSCEQDADGFLIVLGDMIGLRAEDLNDLLSCFEGRGSIAVAESADHLGPPIIFGSHFRTQLETLNGPGGASSIWKEHLDQVVPCRLRPGALIDVDTQSELGFFVSND